MKKYSYFLLFTFLFTIGCVDKKVELPQIALEGIPQIHNHSSIWVFYEVKNQDTIAVLNKNNKILNTHWIFNIDKRLTMKAVVPVLEKMQKIKNKDSMHKKEGMLNYFSYSDVKSKQISVLSFNPTIFVFTEEEQEKRIENIFASKIIRVDIQNKVLYLNGKKVSDQALLSQKITAMRVKDSLSTLKVMLKYSANTSYQDYLKTKVFLNSTQIQTDVTEYIYSLK